MAMKRMKTAIQDWVAGMRERRMSRRSRRTWRASLAETRRSQWHRLHDS